MSKVVASGEKGKVRVKKYSLGFEAIIFVCLEHLCALLFGHPFRQ